MPQDASSIVFHMSPARHISVSHRFHRVPARFTTDSTAGISAWRHEKTICISMSSINIIQYHFCTAGICTARIVRFLYGWYLLTFAESSAARCLKAK